MIRVLLALFLAVIVWSVPASAQQYKAAGVCELTSGQTGSAVSFTASASAACNGVIPANARTVEICIEAQAIRYRDDGVAPTATIGVPIAAGNCFPYAGKDLSAIQFIAQTSGAIVWGAFYIGPQ